MRGRKIGDIGELGDAAETGGCRSHYLILQSESRNVGMVECYKVHGRTVSQVQVLLQLMILTRYTEGIDRGITGITGIANLSIQDKPPGPDKL